MMYIAFTLIGLNIVLGFVFHFSTLKERRVQNTDDKPAPQPAKLISKREAYGAPARTDYDYGRISMPEAYAHTKDSEPPPKP